MKLEKPGLQDFLVATLAIGLSTAATKTARSFLGSQKASERKAL
jgi:hypothetical protein